MEKPSPSLGIGRSFSALSSGLSRRSAKTYVIFTPFTGSFAASSDFSGVAAVGGFLSAGDLGSEGLGDAAGGAFSSLGAFGTSTGFFLLAAGGVLAAGGMGGGVALLLSGTFGGSVGFLPSAAGAGLVSVTLGGSAGFLASTTGMALASGALGDSAGFLPSATDATLLSGALGGSAAVLLCPGGIPDPAGVPHPGEAEAHALYMACANLIFPGWVSEHTVLYGVILAVLLLVTVLRWAAPWLMEYMEDRRIKGQIAAQAHMARELGYQDDQFGFVVEDGSVKIKFEE